MTNLQENESYLGEQLISYLGNKRSLLGAIKQIWAPKKSLLPMFSAAVAWWRDLPKLTQIWFWQMIWKNTLLL